jgi:c-di-GMP-binding flagellar brake protein YcgR
LQPGTEVRGFLNHEGGKFFFVSAVIGHQLEPLPMLVLTKPDRLIKGQRRHFLRVRATIFPIECWIIDTDPEECRPIKIATLDISGGGLRFVGIDELAKDTHVRVKLDLPFECGIVDAMARVIRSEQRQEGAKYRFESAAIFEDIAEGDRDRICKFALKQQLSSARTGIWKRQ